MSNVIDDMLSCQSYYTIAADSMEKYGDKKKGYFRLSKNNLSLKSKICVFVLGPSASGKTFLTFAQLPRVLQLNGISIQDDSDVSFVSVDGGLMRDT